MKYQKRNLSNIKESQWDRREYIQEYSKEIRKAIYSLYEKFNKEIEIIKKMQIEFLKPNNSIKKKKKCMKKTSDIYGTSLSEQILKL
jgi:hypothetical protein